MDADFVDRGEGQARPSPFDRPAVEAWLEARLGTFATPIVWQQLAGGHSNLTFRLGDAAGRSLVVRRPPVGPLLPKAHDMAREWQVLTGLHPTGVPVPEPLAFCDDETVTGAPFYAMQAVAGDSLLLTADFDMHVAANDRRPLGLSLVGTLAMLHNLQPEAVHLAALGAPDGYLARQLRSWQRSWEASCGATGFDDPRFSSVHERLLASMPAPQRCSVVHGDFGLHNCLVANGRVSSVLDWEICTLGDPLADLGYVLARWPGTPFAATLASHDCTAVRGLPSRREAAEKYAVATGLNLDQLSFYLAFNYWKVAAIVNGVHARYVSGQKAVPPSGLDEFSHLADRALGLAVQVLDTADATTLL